MSKLRKYVAQRVWPAVKSFIADLFVVATTISAIVGVLYVAINYPLTMLCVVSVVVFVVVGALVYEDFKTFREKDSA